MCEAEVVVGVQGNNERRNGTKGIGTMNSMDNSLLLCHDKVQECVWVKDKSGTWYLFFEKYS